MVLHRVAIVGILLGLVTAVPAWSQNQNEGMPREACLSSGETRDLFVADKLVQPFKVMRDAARSVQAEAIDIQLCRNGGALVYDVTLLDPQGRVFHCLINATTGAPMPGPPPGAEPRPPRPTYQGRGSVPDDDPGPGQAFGGNGGFGPRYGPNLFGGPRPGRYLYQGPRQGAPFYPWARPGERGPGGME